MTSVFLSSRFSFLLTLFLALVLVGCDSGGSNSEPEPEPEPIPAAPPSFEIASRTVTLQDNTDGVQFFVRSSIDVILVRVDIETPLGGEISFNAGSSTVIKDESFALQDGGTAYVKVSGNWRFILVGRHAADTQASFEVTETVNVGA